MVGPIRSIPTTTQQAMSASISQRPNFDSLAGQALQVTANVPQFDLQSIAGPSNPAGPTGGAPENPFFGYANWEQSSPAWGQDIVRNAPTTSPQWAGQTGDYGFAPGTFVEKPSSAPPNVLDLQGYIQQLDQRRQLLQAQADRAAGFNAWAAEAQYKQQISMLDRDIGQLQAGLANTQAAWDAWKGEASSRIAEAAERAVSAYDEYKSLIEQGYSEYDAEVRSRFGEYQAQVQSLVGGYMQATNAQYGELIGQIPDMYKSAVRSVTENNLDAVAAIREEYKQYRESAAGQVVEATSELKQVMRKMRADRPELATELLTEIEQVARQSRERAQVTKEGMVSAQRAAARVAAATSQYQMQERLSKLEEARVVAVNDARRMREQLITASNQQLERALEESGFSREQMLQQVDDTLNSYLKDLDEMNARVFEEQLFGEQAMRYELEEQLRNLGDQRSAADLDNMIKQRAAALESAAATDRLDKLGYAGGFVADTVSKFEGITEAEKNQIIGTIAQWAEDGGISLTIPHPSGYEEERWFELSSDGFSDYIQTMIDNGIETPFTFAGQDPAAFEKLEMFKAAITAWDQGAAAYDNSLVGQFNGAVVHPLGSGFAASDDFGANRPGGRSHGGTDMSAPEGTPIYSYADGQVADIWYDGDEYGGWSVAIDHGNGYTTRYMHLRENPEELGLAEGQWLEAGEAFAFVGATGNARGPHLHWAIYKDGNAQRPLDYLSGFYGSP